MFKSNDEKLSYTDYQLPFDIYWFSQSHEAVLLKSTNQGKKKQITEPKQKQSLSLKKTVRHIEKASAVEQNNLPCNINNQMQHNNVKIDKDLMKMEELTQHEKKIILQSSTFLIRNLRRIKQKQEIKDKSSNRQKQTVNEQPLPLFFSQNYYHPNLIQQTTNPTKYPALSHKGSFLSALSNPFLSVLIMMNKSQ